MLVVLFLADTQLLIERQRAATTSATASSSSTATTSVNNLTILSPLPPQSLIPNQQQHQQLIDYQSDYNTTEHLKQSTIDEYRMLMARQQQQRLLIEQTGSTPEIYALKLVNSRSAGRTTNTAYHHQTNQVSFNV